MDYTTTNLVIVTPLGGAMWMARAICPTGESLSSFESGELDDDGEWIGCDEDIIEDARKQLDIPDSVQIRIEG